MWQARQGDVLLIRVDDVSEEILEKKGKPEAYENGHAVLAHGEATGHTHAIPQSDAMLYNLDVDRYLSVKKTTALRHQEHAPIDLKPGVYKVLRQKEYESESWRLVAD